MGKNRATIQGIDRHALEAAEGWLALGNATEALLELENVTPAHRLHPQVLLLKWEAYAAKRMWVDALGVATLLVEKEPEEVGGWIHRSYALRRAPQGGVQAALDALLPAFQKFPKVSTIPYNIACYHAQLGQTGEAWDWLHRAMESAGDVAAIKAMALQDEDLKLLWTWIREL